MTGWKKPIAGTSNPNHASSTCNVSRPKSDTVTAEPPLPDPGHDTDHEEDQAEEPDDVTEAGVDAEPVHEGVLVDRLAVAVDLAGDEEGAVPGEPDLKDDGDQEKSRPPLVQSLQRDPPRTLWIEAREAYDVAQRITSGPTDADGPL